MDKLQILHTHNQEYKEAYYKLESETITELDNNWVQSSSKSSETKKSIITPGNTIHKETAQTIPKKIEIGQSLEIDQNLKESHKLEEVFCKLRESSDAPKVKRFDSLYLSAHVKKTSLTKPHSRREAIFSIVGNSAPWENGITFEPSKIPKFTDKNLDAYMDSGYAFIDLTNKTFPGKPMFVIFDNEGIDNAKLKLLSLMELFTETENKQEYEYLLGIATSFEKWLFVCCVKATNPKEKNEYWDSKMKLFTEDMSDLEADELALWLKSVFILNSDEKMKTYSSG